MLARPGNYHFTFVAIALALFLCLAVYPAAAQQSLTKFSTSVRPSSGSTSDQFLFSVNVEGQTETAYPFLTGGDDFKLTLIGPQTSVNVVNGVVSQKVSYVYRLIPKKSGFLLTPAAEIEINGQRYQAEPLKVEVKEGQTPSSADEPVFVQQNLNQSSVYVGQQVINSVELYAREPVIEPQLNDQTLDGFWSEELEKQSNLTRYVEGKQYDLLIVKNALFPLRAGELIVPARQFSGQIREARKQNRSPFPFGGPDPFDQDIFDNFFGIGRVKPFSATSNALKLEVKPLPQPPSDYDSLGISSVIVGSLALNIDFDSKAIEVGESKTVEVRISSEGNLNPLKALPLRNSSQFKVYQESPQLVKRAEAGRLVSEWTERLSIVPLVPGALKIPALKVSYFDPIEGRYKTALSKPIEFLVNGEATSSPLPAQPSAKSSLSQLNIESPPAESDGVMPAPSLLDRLFQHIAPSTLLMTIMLALGIVCALVAVLYQKSKQVPLLRLESNVSTAHSLSELNQALRDALSFHFKISLELAGEELKARIRSSVRDPEVQLECIALIEQLNYAQYAPQSEKGGFDQFKARALNILKAFRSLSS